MNLAFKSTDEYINSFPEETQVLLKKMRAIVRQAAPEAQESLSYGMPAYKLNGKPLVYFAAFKKHIGFYAMPTGYSRFRSELSKYKQGKGSVQFPIDQPLPLDLIAEIVKFRVRENLSREK
jgi:uncharacterized protein YdhG (YjbR/CyaY superfamily)